jgi:hypothetical protein
VQLEGLVELEKFIHFIGSRTRDLLACREKNGIKYRYEKNRAKKDTK